MGALKCMVAAALAAALAFAQPSAAAQRQIQCGGGSFASCPPFRSGDARAIADDKFRFMMERPLFMTARNAGKPLPTNDWWTDSLVSQWTGNLWSYPAKVRIAANGIRIAFPKAWSDDGTELKERSALRIFAAGARPFSPKAALVDDWHDWDVEILLADGERQIRATLVHGSPFTWIESRGVDLFIAADAGEDGSLVERRGQDDGGELFDIGGDLYGVWRGRNGGTSWIAVGLLPDEAAYARLAPYASAIVRSTRVDWSFDQGKAEVSATWNVETENLRTEGPASPPALQGFQPHHLKGTRLSFRLEDGLSWHTPRGLQRVATGNSLTLAYPFPGILPYWAAPDARTASGPATAYDPALFASLVSDYARSGTFGADTYWGGKGLLQMAFAMMGARETGDAASFDLARRRLRETMEDWLTFAPGEKERYFAFMPRWGGLVGINPSYDSETFNDHHFHYGYFTYAGALLCMADGDFAEKFGPMLRLMAKDYANWERDDSVFPFFRTFDPWAGHSFAGGMGDGNGNGQESSSEAMQGWAGLFLLGQALGDDAMSSAGAFGYVSEARATAEYWFDRDRENIDRSKYRHPYCSNLTCHGVGWWTFFSGDPVWMHSIQWLPNTPGLDYLSEDLGFAKWDWETMWSAKEIGGWFDKGRDRDGNETGCVGDASLGNVLLSYLQRHDPAQAAKIFAELRKRGLGAATNPDTAHMTYWAIHSHLDCGELDFTMRSDCPTARSYLKDGKRTFAVYNPARETATASFFSDEGKTIATVEAAPRALTVKREGKPLAISPIAATGPARAHFTPDTLHCPLDIPELPEIPEPQPEAALDMDIPDGLLLE